MSGMRTMLPLTQVLKAARKRGKRDGLEERAFSPKTGADNKQRWHGDEF